MRFRWHGISIGKGEQINCNCTRQLNKPRNILPNKIIIEVDMPSIGIINFHNRLCVNKVSLKPIILTKDWARRFNLSIFGMICAELFISATRREVIASCLAVLRMSSSITHREFA